MKTYSAVYHTDPGHGWLEVPLIDLIHLNIYDKISHYSYRDIVGEYVYLEEDCDARIFLDTLKNLGFDVLISHKEHKSAPWNDEECIYYVNYSSPYTITISSSYRDYGTVKVELKPHYSIYIPDDYVSPLVNIGN